MEKPLPDPYLWAGSGRVPRATTPAPSVHSDGRRRHHEVVGREASAGWGEVEPRLVGFSVERSDSVGDVSVSPGVGKRLPLRSVDTNVKSSRVSFKDYNHALAKERRREKYAAPKPTPTPTPTVTPSIPVFLEQDTPRMSLYKLLEAEKVRTEELTLQIKEVKRALQEET